MFCKSIVYLYLCSILDVVLIYNKMKGLERYIGKHGKHITPKLASEVLRYKWDSSEVYSMAQKTVYYNVTDTTSEDMTYMVNAFYADNKWSKNTCVKYALYIIGNYKIGVGYAFEHLLNKLYTKGIDIDFEEYA